VTASAEKRIQYLRLSHSAAGVDTGLKPLSGRTLDDSPNSAISIAISLRANMGETLLVP
jgi:hypothetical protein